MDIENQNPLCWSVDDMLREALSDDVEANKAVLIRVRHTVNSVEADGVEIEVSQVGCNDLELQGILSYLNALRPNR